MVKTEFKIDIMSEVNFFFIIHDDVVADVR
jgi:hypothetical protein